MQINPVLENNASDEIKTIYDAIKQSLDVQRVPLFFTYMAAFPNYLSYISNQLTENLKDPSFTSLSNQIGNEMIELIKEHTTPGEDVREWVEKYGESPSFYYFLQDTDHIFRTNVKLALIFVALREAVKGWAVAAKKLPGQASKPKKESVGIIKKEEFIFEDVETPKIVMPQTKKNQPVINTSRVRSNGLARRQETAIERDLLPQYLQLCKIDFYQQMKTASFWELRIAIEKFILNALPIMPHIVFSPINVVIDLTKKYNDFPDLLYLLSEHFPTYAVQRMMFSGYMHN